MGDDRGLPGVVGASFQRFTKVGGGDLLSGWSEHTLPSNI